MNYYGDPDLARVKELIDAEVREGTRSLRASYLSGKYTLDPPVVHRVISDLAALGDLQPHYQVLCSGRNQRFDPDREFTDRREIPKHPITCQQCGDTYTPSEDNIIVSFEPTPSYLESLGQKR